MRAFTTTVFVGKLALPTRQMNLAKSTKIKMRDKGTESNEGTQYL